MFLASTYTLEAFFWIIVVAIILVGANLFYAIVTDADFTDSHWYETSWTDGIRYDSNQA